MTQKPLARAETFCARYGLSLPILEAPMAGACTPARSAAVSRAGGLGAMGALLTEPAAIGQWVQDFRALGGGPLHINMWIPGAPPIRDAAAEAAMRAFLGQWGPAVPPQAGDAGPPDFAAQCEAMIAARPAVISSIMGLYDAPYVARMKAAGIAWFATATTLAEALAAQAAGADAVIAQGYEAGGHRGTFDIQAARSTGIGTLALVPVLADRLAIPVIAAGGIADGRGVAAALALGASAAMIGTALLRCPEGDTPPAWADALADTPPEGSAVTRGFSGRPGRALITPYIRALTDAGLDPAPYPVQRGLTAAMRKAAVAANDLAAMQAWSGQAAMLAKSEPAEALIARIWREGRAILA